MDRRQLLLSVFQQGLAAVNGRSRVRAALTQPRAPRGPWHVIAIGKAASAMTLGAYDALGAQIERALVISKSEHFDLELSNLPGVRCLAASHPIPDEASLEAGAALLAQIEATPGTHRLLFLVSGGASSLVESLRPGVPLEALRRFNEWALGSGLGIGAVNALRQRLSGLKGGGLLPRLAGHDVLALFISDVPGNDPNVIGSGILGDASPVAVPAALPDWVRALVDGAGRSEPPRPAARLDRRVIAGIEDAIAGAQQFGVSQGLRVHCETRRFDADAVDLARRFCHELELSDAQLHIWAGESTVKLPRHPGRGGRNQHLALAAARLLVDHGDLLLLAAGTDGSDGNIDAGAIVDGGTVERGTVEGFDVDDCLARADSARFLDAAGDLVHTGPTGTNVGDLVLGLKMPPRPA